MSKGQGIGLNNMQAVWFFGRTGTGSAETIPHGMGTAPAIVLVMVRDSAKTYLLEVATDPSTNLKITVENGATYDVLAFFSRE